MFLIFKKVYKSENKENNMDLEYVIYVREFFLDRVKQKFKKENIQKQQALCVQLTASQF